MGCTSQGSHHWGAGLGAEETVGWALSGVGSGLSNSDRPGLKPLLLLLTPLALGWAGVQLERTARCKGGGSGADWKARESDRNTRCEGVCP